MKFTYLWTTVMSCLLFSCHPETDLPNPQYGIAGNTESSSAGCQVQFFQFDLNSEMYSINDGEWLEFNSTFTASADFFPEVQIIMESETMTFCDFLELSIEGYAYTVEQLTNPQRSRYTVQLSEEALVPLVNGVSVAGKFKRHRRYETTINAVAVK
jgi:hypothetical protein